MHVVQVDLNVEIGQVKLGQGRSLSHSQAAIRNYNSTSNLTLMFGYYFRGTKLQKFRPNVFDFWYFQWNMPIIQNLCLTSNSPMFDSRRSRLAFCQINSRHCVNSGQRKIDQKNPVNKANPYSNPFGDKELSTT